MLSVEGRIYLRINIGGIDLPENSVGLTQLILQSDCKMGFPAMQLELEDTYKLLNNPQFIVLKDGLPVTITVGRTEADSQTYRFRLFSPRRSSSEINPSYVLTGYYDAPGYIFESTNEAFKGTSSEVIKTIAEKFGLTYVGDPTSDSQIWYGGNKRYYLFANHLKEHAYSGNRGLRVMGITIDGRLLYLDYNKIEAKSDGLKFAYSPNTNNVFPISEHKVLDNPGFTNATRGYKYSLIEQDIEEQVAPHTDIEIRKMADVPNLESEIHGKISQGMIQFSPIHGDTVHDNYYKAYHMNNRGYYLNNSGICLMTNFPTQRDLFDPVQVSLQKNTGSQGTSTPDEVYDGEYIIVSKQVIVKGINYAERFWMNRCGINTGSS